MIEKIGQITVEHKEIDEPIPDGAAKLRAIVEWMNSRPEELNEGKSHLTLIIEYNSYGN